MAGKTIGRERNLGKKLVHLTAGAVFFYLALLVIVFVAQEVISEERIVDKGLENDVHETCLTEV